MTELSQYHQGFIAGFLPGFLLGMGLMKTAWDHEDRQRRRRRSFNHENTNTPSGPPPLRLRRSGDPGSLRHTITSSGSGYRPIPGVEPPKPEFPPPREIPADWP